MHEGHILASRSDDPEELKDFEFLLAASADDAFNALVCVRFATEPGQQHVNQLAYAREDHHNLNLSREWRGKIVITRDGILEPLPIGRATCREELVSMFRSRRCP